MSLSLYLFLLALWLQGARITVPIDYRRYIDVTEAVSWGVVTVATVAFAFGK